MNSTWRQKQNNKASDHSFRFMRRCMRIAFLWWPRIYSHWLERWEFTIDNSFNFFLGGQLSKQWPKIDWPHQWTQSADKSYLSNMKRHSLWLLLTTLSFLLFILIACSSEDTEPDLPNSDICLQKSFDHEPTLSAILDSLNPHRDSLNQTGVYAVSYTHLTLPTKA